MYQVPLVVYAQLKEATPEEKREIVLSLIEEHPEHRLELPERDGVRADLSGVDLSRVALQELVQRRAGAAPPWWDAIGQPAGLRHAGDELAYLFDAKRQGANLRRADLQGANLRRAKLQGASLVQANLQGAILIDANLQGAILIDANLEGGFLNNADLQGANLISAALQGTKLEHADLQDAKLMLAELQGDNLYRANLQGADLEWANLQGAFLRDAELEGVDLSTCTLTHCYLSHAWLDRTRLRREQLGGAVGEELDGDYAEAKVAYLGLKRNFSELGDYAASSWAYRKERRMEKLEALERARDARARRDWKEALFSCIKALGDQIVELVCDYGEGFWRVLGCLALLWVGFPLFYGITGHVLADRGPVCSTTRNLIDLLSFSLATMVTLEAPGLWAHESLLMRILMPLQAALGVFFLGLLGFVAGNRIRRS